MTDARQSRAELAPSSLRASLRARQSILEKAWIASPSARNDLCMSAMTGCADDCNDGRAAIQSGTAPSSLRASLRARQSILEKAWIASPSARNDRLHGRLQ